MSWSSLRRWMLGILVALALIAFVPGQVFRIIHVDNARQLVADISTGRAELLAKQDEFRSPIMSLGTAIRAWTQVSCWLSPRYSDGDGEQDVVMFYWQECSLMAYEIYALPPPAGDAAHVAERLSGHIVGAPTCAEILFDVLTPDYGASRPSEYATALWWVNPAGEPPADQPDRCALPRPGDSDNAHLESTADGPMIAKTYVVYQVRSPVRTVDVGCERRLSWLAPCAGEPPGFPVF